MAGGRDDIRPLDRQPYPNGSRHAGTNRGAGRRHTHPRFLGRRHVLVSDSPRQQQRYGLGHL